MRSNHLILIGLLAFVLRPGTGAAATLTVTRLDDTGSGSLRAQIAAAAPGDTIRFAPHVVGVIPLTQGQLLIDKNLRIEGPGKSVLAIDAQSASRLLEVTQAVVHISGLTWRNGLVRGADGASATTFGERGHDGESASGGAILNFGDLTIADCLLLSHRVVGGNGGNGAPDLAGATATMGGTGGMASGGAIFNGRQLILANSTIEGGVAMGGNGGDGGDASHHIGGFAGTGGYGYDGLGGGIYNIGTLMASNCLIYRCHTGGGRGGRGGEAVGPRGVTGGHGGSGGHAFGAGLHDFNENSSITTTSLLVNCTFNANDCRGGGGGNSGSGIVRDGRGGNGGEAYGGAILNHILCETTLIHATIINCHVVPGDEGYSPDFNHNGLRGRALGGGLAASQISARIYVHNTVLAFNTATTADHDFWGPVRSGGFNLVRDRGTSTGWVASDQTGTSLSPLDPQILPFTDNGGPSPTVMPRRGSPLVDRGDASVLTARNLHTDQRGAYRMAGGNVDIGAVEAPYGWRRFVVNTEDSGFGSLREALSQAQAEAGASYAQIHFAPWVRGVIALTSGELTLEDTYLIGPGAGVLSISGNHRSRVFRVLPGTQASSVWGVTICDGLTRANSSAAYGGGILAESDLYLFGCVISNNRVVGQDGANRLGAFPGQAGGAAFGGGIHHLRGLILNECVVSDNWALGGNGGDGRHGGLGGGAYGGGISGTNGASAQPSQLLIFSSTISDNRSVGGRAGNGALSSVGPGDGGGGGAAHGGGLHIASSASPSGVLSVVMERCSVHGNQATGGLGGMDAAGAGGGDNAGGTALGGGAVLNAPSALVSCTLSGNQAQGGLGGDGIIVAGVRQPGGFGGTAAGGGLLRSPLFSGGMSNCTITANAALAGLAGLAVNETRPYVGSASGGGVWDSGGGSPLMTVHSCLIAGNHAVGLNHEETGTRSDWFGPVISAGYNLIGVTNAYGWPAAPGDRLGSASSPLEPKLGPLQDNGGNVPTNRPFLYLTHALLPGSPALDAGKSSELQDQRGAVRHHDDPAVPNAAGGDGSDIGAVENGHVQIVRIAGVVDPNREPSVSFTTLPARRHFLESADVLSPGQWRTMGPSLFGNGGLGELPDTGGPAATRFYRVRAEVARKTLVYANDFEGTVGGEWNVAERLATTPVSARRFLGELEDETASLQLAGLPAHTQLQVSFDLFILKSWDGNNLDYGPDQFYVQMRGGEKRLIGTFSNYSPVEQSFPGVAGAGYPHQTGASERNTLGYTHPNIGPADAVYRVVVVFDHAESSAVIDFLGVNLQALTDESWGLDNVRVEVIQAP